MPRVFNYGHHPELWFLDLGSDPVQRLGGEVPEGKKYVGVELEVEATSDRHHDCYEIAGNIPPEFQEDLYFFLKEDGSLRNGFEIVTHPRTMRKFYAEKERWGEFFQHLISRGMRSYDSGRCGLHMHFSLTHFENVSHAMKMLSFFSKNPAFSLALSRRSENSLSNYANIPGQDIVTDCRYATDFTQVSSNRGYMSGALTPGRHSIAHISQYNTMELRLFRGTLNLESFYTYLDLAQAVIEWTETHSDIDGYNVEKFIESCAKKYPNVARVAAIALKRSKTKRYASFDRAWTTPRRVVPLGDASLATIAPSRMRQSHKQKRNMGKAGSRDVERMTRPWWLHEYWWERARKLDKPSDEYPFAERYAFSLAVVLYAYALGECESPWYDDYRARTEALGISLHQEFVLEYLNEMKSGYPENPNICRSSFDQSHGMVIARGSAGISRSYFRPVHGSPSERRWSGPLEPHDSITVMDTIVRNHGLGTFHCTVFADSPQAIQLGMPITETWRPSYYARHPDAGCYDSNFVIIPMCILSGEYPMVEGMTMYPSFTERPPFAEYIESDDDYDEEDDD